MRISRFTGSASSVASSQVSAETRLRNRSSSSALRTLMGTIATSGSVGQRVVQLEVLAQRSRRTTPSPRR